MKRIIKLSALFIVFSNCVVAQHKSDSNATSFKNPPVSAEFFVGGKYTTFQNFITKRFSEKSPLSLYNIAVYNAGYDRKQSPEVDIQTLVTAKIWKGFTAGPGVLTTSNSFNPIVGLKHVYSSKVFSSTIVPVMIFTSQKPQQTILFIAQYRPALTSKVKLYSRIQLFGTFQDFQQYSYIYEQLRLGLDTKKTQFGIGITFQQIQYVNNETPFSNPNIGVFIRKELFN